MLNKLRYAVAVSYPKLFTSEVNGLLKPLGNGLLACRSNLDSTDQKYAFHTSLPRSRKEDMRALVRITPRKDLGNQGEFSFEMGATGTEDVNIFPTVDTPNKLFDGVHFSDHAIVNIKATPNNTIMTVTDYRGTVLAIHSCGVEGFKNVKKGTNVAAQATGITLGLRCLEKGVKTVRIRVKGLGPGRVSAMKGLVMAGINVISVTDNTPICEYPPRPKKLRRV